MKNKKFSEIPSDLKSRIGATPIVCYPNTNIEEKNLSILHSAREHLVKKDEVIIPPRDAKTFEVKFGEFFRIESVEGPQVGDLNLFNLNNLEEKFYSGKTRALYGTHLSVGDKMFSSFPYLRSLAYETLSPAVSFFTETSYSLIEIYLGISPINLRANNSKDASAPS